MNTRAFKRWWYRNELFVLGTVWPVLVYAFYGYFFYVIFAHLATKYAEFELLLRQCAAH